VTKTLLERIKGWHPLGDAQWKYVPKSAQVEILALVQLLGATHHPPHGVEIEHYRINNLTVLQLYSINMWINQDFFIQWSNDGHK